MESRFGKTLRVAVIGARGYVGKAISESLKINTLIELVEVTRKNYEEKKALKLGFKSLYDYFEDKILKEKKGLEDKNRELEEIKANNKLDKKEKKSCGCC